MASSSSSTAAPSPAAPPLWPPLPDTILGESSLHIYTTNVFPTRALRELQWRYGHMGYRWDIRAGRLAYFMYNYTQNHLKQHTITSIKVIIVYCMHFLQHLNKRISMNQKIFPIYHKLISFDWYYHLSFTERAYGEPYSLQNLNNMCMFVSVSVYTSM